MIREDVALLMVANALKNLANELNLFIWTATQFNAKGVTDEFITSNCLRGSRAIADKIDFGGGMRKTQKEDLAKVQTLIESCGISPNFYLDIYKNRRSRMNSVRLWFHADLGTMRYTGLFVTDHQYNFVECAGIDFEMSDDGGWTEWAMQQMI